MGKYRRVLAYSRVSTIGQADGSSLDDQLESIKRHAKALGVTTVEKYVEAESAKGENIENREQVLRIIREAKPGDVVVVDKLDRWSRDLVWSVSEIRKLVKRGVGFMAVAESLDATTGQGDSMLGIHAWVAEEERKRIRARMIGTRQLLRERGYYIDGQTPFGYKRGPNGDNRNVLVIDEAQADTVRDIYRLAIVGGSLDAITDKTGVRRETVGDILRSRFYLGEIWMGKADRRWVKGKHEPIIDAATWAAARKAVQGRKKKGRRATERGTAETATWILRDVARCASCNLKMGADYAGKVDARGLHTRWYYRARCKHGGYLNVQTVEPAADALVLAHLIQLKAELGEAPKQPPKATTAQDKIKRLEAKRARLITAYSDGLIDKQDLTTRIVDVDSALAEVRAQPTDPLRESGPRREALSNVDMVMAAWSGLEPQDKRAIINSLVSQVSLQGGRPPEIVWHTENLKLRVGAAADYLLSRLASYPATLRKLVERHAASKHKHITLATHQRVKNMQLRLSTGGIRVVSRTRWPRARAGGIED